MRMIFYSLVLVAIFFAIVFLPGPSTKPTAIVIQHGSLIKASQTLSKENIIYNDLLFFIPAKIANYFKTLKAGEYEFKKHTSIYNIIEKMQRGDVVFHKISIPEGFSSKEILDLVNSNSILSGIISDTNVPEGVFLPETYYFTRGEQKQIILARMKSSMTETVEQLWQNRSIDIPIKNKEDFIILASIVEKEAKSDSDRKKIASVFLNRIKKGMKLQADPTVIYAITKGQYKLNRTLLTKDLNMSSPWNTYYISSLPPTPIANPGTDSLKVVARPIITNYLYFVVTDCQGNHAFASNVKDHKKNVRDYRKLKCDNV